MSSIADCMAIVGSIDPLVSDKLIERLDRYLDSGVAPTDAQRMAVSDYIAALEARRDAVLGAAKEQHPDAFAEDVAPAEPEGLKHFTGPERWSWREFGRDVRGPEDDFRFSIRERGAWYSALSRAIEKGPGRAPVEQWLAFLKGLPGKGVKQDEVTWSGVEEWLKLQQGKVTREAVVEYLAGNGVRVEEVVLGGNGLISDSEAEDIGGRFWPAVRAEGLDVEEVERGLLDGSMDIDDFEPGMRADAQALRDYMLGRFAHGNRSTKYGTYTLPGGINYREVLLTLPERRPLTNAWRKAQEEYGDDDPRTIAAKKAARAEAGPSKAYRSAHWDTENVLAHIRLNDRVDSDGRRVLLVEELQSDWQAARRKQEKAIAKAVDSDFNGIVERMKKAGVLEVNCD